MTKKTTNLTSPPRERVSVDITGLDLSAPDDLVTDGKCQRLHNLRFEASAWRPVHPYTLKGSVRYPAGAKGSIAYHHPVAGDDVFIIEIPRFAVGASSFEYASYNIKSSETSTIASFSVAQKVSHFGNLLYFTNGTAQSVYLYNGSSYSPVALPEQPSISSSIRTSGGNKKPTYWMLNKGVRIENLQIGNMIHDFYIPADTPVFFDPAYGKDELYNGVIQKIRELYDDGTLEYGSISVRFLYNLYDYGSGISNMPTISGEDYINTDCWHGESCFFAAYRFTDGSSIISSPVTLLSSNTYFLINFIKRQTLRVLNPIADSGPQYIEQSPRLYAYTPYRPITNKSTDYIKLEDSPISYARYELSLTIPTGIDTRLFQSVALYSTRVHQILPIDEMLYLPTDEEMPISSIFGSRDTIDKTFYLAKEWDIATLADSQINIDINNGFFNDIVSKPVYTPSQTNIIGGIALDFNNRRHLANISTNIPSSFFLNNPFTKGTQRVASGLVLKDDFSYRNLITTPNDDVGFELSAPYNIMLSFPDVNVDSFIVYRDGEYNAFSYKAKVSYKNNLAYFLPPVKATSKYYPISLSDDYTDRPLADSLTTDSTFVHPNKIKVSASNNSFVYPFENTYSIGSSTNRIIAIQSAAIEMPEMKIGEMPLYVFTTEGIYALIAGSETLYARVSPINYDKIINPNVIAINGAIVYITEKGVHLLTNQGSQVISTPIHDKSNRPPLEFLRICQMIYPKEHNEVVFLDPSRSTTSAYIFNLDGMYWSTRDLVGEKLNTDDLIDGATIYDLANEDESAGLPIDIASRPMKLGDLEFKRIETLIPRIYSGSDPTALYVAVSGSIDGKMYQPLRECTLENVPRQSINPLVLRRTPFSAKYFQFLLSMTAIGKGTFDPTITNIDIEWYRRLRHKMR